LLKRRCRASDVSYTALRKAFQSNVSCFTHAEVRSYYSHTRKGTEISSFAADRTGNRNQEVLCEPMTEPIALHCRRTAIVFMVGVPQISLPKGGAAIRGSERGAARGSAHERLLRSLELRPRLKTRIET
jgi:hypothetical protein